MRKNISSSILKIIALLLILFIFLLSKVSFTDWFSKDVSFFSQNQSCDLHDGPCEIKDDEGRSFLLEISPKSIPLMEPLTFTLRTNYPNLEMLKGKIYATNMNMGVHLITLKSLKDGLLEGEVVLPTCVVGNMKWRCEFVLPSKKDGEKKGIVFMFKTDR